MKSAKVKILFMEHLFYDSTQAWLDSYFYSGNNAPMPRYLEAYLKNLSQGQFNSSRLYNYYEVVKAAKAANIRVVALDTTVSYLAGSSDKSGVKEHMRTQRYQAMSYVASQIILHELSKVAEESKFVAFMGSSHVGTINGILGVSSILGCPSLVIEEAIDKQTTLTFDVKNLHDEIDHVTVYQRMPTF